MTTALVTPAVHRVIVWGIPRTKKTSNRIVTIGARVIGGQRVGGRPIVLPSKAWEDWVTDALIVGQDATGGTGPAPILLTGDFNCRALFYRDAERGDLVGYMQGLADLLEKRQVIVNDRQIKQWDGSRLLKDAAHPRVELVLEPLEAEADPREAEPESIAGGFRGEPTTVRQWIDRELADPAFRAAVEQDLAALRATQDTLGPHGA